ncbi:MAG TPA: hypothetical protein V6C58_18535 [Allocoleopsis sp.]
MSENDMNSISKTDWSRIDAMLDEDIDTSDIPPLSEDFFLKAKLRLPNSSTGGHDGTVPTTIAVEIDTDTLAWFKLQGETAQQHMSAALRIYAEAHKHTEQYGKLA